MANGTRYYEVPALENPAAEARTYLVEAANPAQAQNKVAQLYVGDAKLVDAKRAMELSRDAKTVVIAVEPGSAG